MCTDKDRPPCEHDDLIGKVDHLQGKVARLTTTIKELRRQLAAAQRSGKRQAAPFSKGKRTSKPRRPGRKPGMGSFSYRKPPAVDELTAPPVDVAVAAESCPGLWRHTRTRGRESCVRDRHSRDAQTPVEGIPCADMPVSWLRQACARASSGCWT